jgi:GNAT superfamily N-acetyltransferase
LSDTSLAPLPAIPATLASRAIDLRAESSTDRAFLVELFIQTRWEELQPTAWSQEQKVAFLTQQFGFQDAHYTRHYQGTARGIVTQNDEPIGRLYLYSLPGELRMVDIALLSTHRSHGIGAALIVAVLEQARGRGEVVTIHVEAFNRARNLYQRLGFIDVGGDAIYRKMQWQAAVAQCHAAQLKTAS